MLKLSEEEIQDKLKLKSDFCSVVEQRLTYFKDRLENIINYRISINLIKLPTPLIIEYIDENNIGEFMNLKFFENEKGLFVIHYGDDEICEIPSADILKNKEKFSRYLLKFIKIFMSKEGKNIKCLNII